MRAQKLFSLLSLLFLALGNQACTKRSGGGSGDLATVQSRRMIGADLPDMNWFTTRDANQSDVLSGNVYQSLITMDKDTYDYKPMIAKSWEISKDKMSFKFTIDEKAKWFDGTPITSKDVEFSLATLFDPKVNSAPLKAVYGSLDPKVQVIDDKTFVIKAKTVHFQNFELAGGFVIFPKHILEGKDINKGPLLTEAFGSGPYVVEEWKKGDRITLKKSPNWWGQHLEDSQGAYAFEKIVYKVVREPKVGLEMLKEGFFSAFEFNSEQWEKEAKNEKIQKQYDTYTFQNKAPNGYSFVGWNNRNAPFDSVNVRKALSLLMNRKLMIEKFTYGYSMEAAGPINRSSEYWPEDVKPIPFDPVAASELLKKEGFKDSNNDGVLDRGGKAFQFTLMFANPDTEKYLTVYQEDLKKAGVKMDLKRVDWTTFVKLLDERKFDAVILGWTASVHPDLEQIWHSDSAKGNGSNFQGYSNKEVDRLIKETQKEFDFAKRKALVQQTVRLIANDVPYTWFLERPTNFVAVKKGIKRKKDFYNYEWGMRYWEPAAQ